ncbi:hypothetical protein PC129_g14928 [Phytophthora cactorum]|uniref:Retrotransposon gag domain-containing protein n=1 Tax=Phytophthora cactorum TaxID=29920 RepID=A0A8T1HPL3_9STRA|nr:hypothetical protein C6341_g7657 [Phytophthora cactorum]KAG3214153.1 hypothetical protein PC129_g14928 [Phytophthora cactorum]
MDRNEFPHLNDSQYESVRKMADIFGMDALQSLVAATPVEQVERVNALDTYERGLISHVRGSMQPPMPEVKPSHQKPLRLKVNPYEGKEGENLHFWVREVELAMDTAQISTEQLRVAFSLSNLSGRTKRWAYTREATTPECFASWAQLCEQLRAAFLPTNYEYCQRSRFLSCKEGKRELHEYIQKMRELTASLVGTPLHEHIKVTVFMDGLRVGPARTQLFGCRPAPSKRRFKWPSRKSTAIARHARQHLRGQGALRRVRIAQPPVDLSPWNSGSPSSRTSAATAAEGWAT